MSDLLVCTAQIPITATEQLEMLEESCRFYNLDFRFWGEGFVGAYHARKVKVAAFIDFLETVNHPYVLFSDGWDSWMLANAETILDVYDSFEKPIVVCGHPYIYPNYLGKKLGITSDSFPECPTRFRHICSGQFMGEREALKEALTVVLETETGGPSDQGAWNTAFAQETITHITEIDYTCRLFLTMEDSLENLYFDSERRVVFKETKTRPIGIHFGGPKGGSPNGLNMERFYKEWLEKR